MHSLCNVTSPYSWDAEYRRKILGLSLFPPLLWRLKLSASPRLTSPPAGFFWRVQFPPALFPGPALCPAHCWQLPCAYEGKGFLHQNTLCSHGIWEAREGIPEQLKMTVSSSHTPSPLHPSLHISFSCLFTSVFPVIKGLYY